MAKAYTPGLKVSARTTHRSRRLLPIRGEVKVAVGDRVSADDVVAETTKMVGEFLLQMEPGMVGANSDAHGPILG